MGEFVEKFQVQIKKSSGDVFNFLIKALSGFILWLTIALVVFEILGKNESESMLTFMFIVLTGMAVFVRIAKKWSLTMVLVFDLICVLIGICLRLYIMIAPGA